MLGEKQGLSEKVSFVTWLGRQQSRQKTHDLHSSCWILLHLMFSWFIYPYFPLNIYLVILISLWCSTGTGCRESWSCSPSLNQSFHQVATGYYGLRQENVGAWLGQNLRGQYANGLCCRREREAAISCSKEFGRTSWRKRLLI